MARKKIMLAGIVMLLLAAVLTAVVLLRGGEKERGPAAGVSLADESEDAYVFVPDDFPQVWFFDENGDFPPWVNPMPFVNPMGGESNYTYIEMRPRSYYTYIYADRQNALTQREVYGDAWLLHVPFDPAKTLEENHQFVYDIEHYIKFKNGTVMGYAEGSIVFVLNGDDGLRWWAEAAIAYDKITLHIVRQDELKVGDTLVIHTADYDENVVRFASYNPGDEYQSIHLEYDAGQVSFEIKTENNFGAYRRSYRTRDTVFDAMGTSFYYDSIMYDPGFSNWEVSWYDPAVTKEIKITLLKTGSLPQIKYGEPLGAIKVSSEFVAGMEAFPLGGNASLSIQHPEFSYEDFYLDRTPDGDFIMFVPAGLWDVKIYPRGDALVSNYETLMVPVHAGEMTEVEVPFLLANAMRARADGYNERGIRIGTLKEDISKNQVTFNFTLLDRSTREILPDTGNTMVMEGGAPVKLLSVAPLKTPPSVVLLLDSSGSMRGQMQATLKAAEQFIRGLPEDTAIRVVDFDDVPRELKGTTKEEAVRNLATIKVGGDTALYEAIKMGLALLAREDRPTLVVFTDGENDVKYSGGLTLAETMQLVQEAAIPLFTIGFGRGHDRATLENLAKVSGGRYFSAADAAALQQVFAAINENLGNTYEATYIRPLEASPGDVPVVSFVIDTSGSMNDYSETYGSRIYNVKKLLRHFVLELPPDVLLQLAEFNDETRIVQALTTDKMKILRGLGRLEAGGATDIVGSVLAGYKTLKEIPSTKKVLIYITDAALETRAGNESFLDLLGQIKKDEIKVLWVGLGVEEEAEDFRLAAALSGGEYVVSEDPALLSQSFNRLLAQVKEAPSSGLSNLFVAIEKTTDTGARESYSTGKLVELSPVKKSGELVVAETIRYLPSKILRQYDSYTAEFISGYGVPAEDTIITKRMAAGKKGANGAAEINASAIVLLKKLGGVAAPANYRFLALTMEMRNILEAQEVTVYPDGSSHPSAWLGGGARGETKLLKIPYLIPDFISHFSLTYNNGGAYPASLATWLAGKPLFAPGDNALMLMPEESITGTLVFLVPDTPMEQLSLHFYDLNYGHIDLPLVGEMRPRSFTLASLPKQEPTSLTDAFTLEITAWDELAEIPGTGKDDGDSGKEHGLTPGAGAVFKVVEGNFTSRLQALLQVDPLERFSLRLKTASGDFYLPVHPATSLLPAGFANPRMLYPGSFNRVRWLFEIPGALRKNTAELHVELRGEDKAAPVATGEMLPGNLNARYSSEFMELTVNDLVKTDSGLPGEYVIADLTIHDKKDGLSSSGIASLFSLVPDAFWEADPAKTAQGGTQGPGSSTQERSGGLGSFAQGDGGSKAASEILLPAALTERLILGFTEESVVYDGTSRRGIIVFQLPPGAENEWYLYGETFAGLKLKVRRGSYSQGLLAEKAYYEEGDNFFAQNLNAAIGLAVERYRLQHPEKTVQLVRGNIPLGEPAVDKQEIPPPALSFYGAQLVREINSVDAMVRAMKRLRYLPSPGSYGAFNYNFAREAVLTQGFGTEQDYAHLAVELLSRMGYQPKLKVVRLTERGRKELAKMSGITEIALDRLPAVAYVDQNNNHRILVMPFLEELEDLKRLVYLDHTPHLEKAPNKIWLEINAYGYATDKGAGEQLGELAGALAGETEGAPGLSSRLLYSDQLALDLLSLDAVDIGIARDGNRARIYLLTAAGEIFGGQYVELDRFEPRKLEFVFSFPNQTRTVHLVRLDEGMEIDDVFITAGINAPDLTPEASKKLQEVADRVYSLVKNPGELSALRWYGRSIIARFISAQTLHDRSLSRELGLTVGRTTRPRVVVVTHKGGKKLRTSLNLLAVHDQVHAGEESRIKTFNMLSGIFASTLEAAVLPGQGSGLAQIWLQAPQGTELVFLEHLEQDARLALERAGASPEMIEHLAQTPNMVLIASKPALIDGYRHWAWFEIDPRTWEMLSVIDTLEKGAFVESTLVDTVRSAGQYAAGAFKGIETSIWSVAKYSLENDDYQEILQAARALALGLAERFGFNMGPLGGSIGGTLSISQTVGPVKFSFDGSASASQNVLGFTEGFRAGVEYYFRRAR